MYDENVLKPKWSPIFQILNQKQIILYYVLTIKHF